jgi:hypothetical protein
MISSSLLTQCWKVLLLFFLPIGGGIPAGVLLAKSFSLGWPVMMAIYFISDLILAIVFEPIMHWMFRAGKKVPAIAQTGQMMKDMTLKTIEGYGKHLGPLALIIFTFTADPMSGRAATSVVGHGFLIGWTLTIIGDMLYFSLIMVSTLWLNNVIGDRGGWTTGIILALMMLIPVIIKKIRNRKNSANP